jgi:Zonular occludens toxin (Zot).
MISRRAMKEEFNPIVKTYQKFKYDIKFRKENPDYFWPDGLLIFIGPQGSGKTLSAVNYVYNLMDFYPKAKLVTNIALTDYPVVTFEAFMLKKYLVDINDPELINDYTPEEYKELINKFYNEYLEENRIFSFENGDDLKRYGNGKYGVIFLVDEIQLYFNSLQSKNINIEVMTQISQQRKQRKHIVCTSQVFGRMAKPLREQFSNVILCKGYFNLFQKCMLIDRDSIDGESSTDTNLTGTVVKNFWYIRSPKMFERYDTYVVIENKNIEATSEKQNIYGREGNINDNS